jgi:hypothetical protein
MSNELHELCTGDLDEVSGGLMNFPIPTGTFLTPSIPIPPPVLGPAPARGDWSWEGNGQSLTR